LLDALFGDGVDRADNFDAVAATPLDAVTVLTLGGWHPARAKVLKVQTRGDFAFASVDANGDGQEIEETYYLWDDGGWCELASGSWGTGPELGHAHGRARGARFVTVSWAGQRHSVPVDPDGEWWFVGRCPANWEGEAPTMPEASYKIELDR
jgi:hypothetical protein